MRMLVDIQFPLEPFNTLLRKGKAPGIIRKVLDDLKPEAMYFTTREGKRGGTLVIDVPGAASMPAIAEPFFLHFDASVTFNPCMTPADLAGAGLEELAGKYS